MGYRTSRQEILGKVTVRIGEGPQYQPTMTTFAGEGVTVRARQGIDAAAKVAAHEARNVRVLSAQARFAGMQVVGTKVEVHYGIDANTGRLVVVGGRSEVRYRPTVDRSIKAPQGSASESTAELQKGAGPDSESGAGGTPAAPAPDKIVDDLRAQEQELRAEADRLRQEAGTRDPDEADQASEALADVEQALGEVQAAIVQAQLEEAQRIQEAVLEQASQANYGIAIDLVQGGQGAADGGERAPAMGRRPFLPAMTAEGLLVNASG